jgi:hypothetical protein
VICSPDRSRACRKVWSMRTNPIELCFRFPAAVPGLKFPNTITPHSCAQALRPRCTPTTCNHGCIERHDAELYAVATEQSGTGRHIHCGRDRLHCWLAGRFSG